MRFGLKQKYDEKLLQLQKEEDKTNRFPYINKFGRAYPVYFKKEYLENLKMNEAEKKAYEKGAGGELIENEKTGKPPKMLSVASSSRFCFLSLRESDLGAFNITKLEGSKIEFEKKLPILGTGTPPHMDAFYDSKDCKIYFECKCHEMFDNSTILLSESYFRPDLICSDIDQSFCEKKEGNKISVQSTYFCSKDGNLTFDVKQLLTHLMGIIRHKGNDMTKARLIYYYFIPDIKFDKPIQSRIESLYSEAEEIFHCNFIQKIINKHNIKIELYIQNSKTVQKATKENTKLKLDSSLN